MLQLQPQKVALQSKVANLGIQTNVDKLKKQLSTKTRLPWQENWNTKLALNTTEWNTLNKQLWQQPSKMDALAD